MKVVYHPAYLEDYPTVSCECPDRILSIYESLKGSFQFAEPEKIHEKDLEMVHSNPHIQNVKKDSAVFTAAVYAASGAVTTARLSVQEPAFGLIRPPGHHASRNSAWGFCFFNNMALSLKILKEHSNIENALILDIDLHFGDGTVNILGDEPWVTIFNARTHDRTAFLAEVEHVLHHRTYDVIGVSAGFDTYTKDWGGILTTEDYRTTGALVKKRCETRFALLEGGYYIPDLGKNVKAFLEGFK
ncbi:MAG: histone deacetylase family protein [Candidatus Methanofastidiosia archaeon]|jgi:acetoin utilization deacetylase AcuC-like enzyme